MVQGTTSDAGKSTLVAALCRTLVRKNFYVAPFKPQNMALNSAVTQDGGEIGRAQALQAQACGLPPHTDMNPVLIKPTSDVGAQIIVQGKALGNMNADTYHQYKPIAKAAVIESFKRLRDKYEVVLVEGAGSPAEINLREGDIANMGFAEEANCPVILIADIDKGGVFAHLVGTLELLSASERVRVKGFVINKFRGDIALLEPGLDWLEQRTHIPVLGVLPYIHDFFIDAEDAIDTRQHQSGTFKVVIPVFPHISNHTDFDPLRLHPNVDLQFVSIKQPPPACDLLILPGSKNVIDDWNELKANDWPASINKHLRYGGKLIGICGGFQMLGQCIDDPFGIEGAPGKTQALGYLPLSTTLAKTKTLEQKEGLLSLCGRQVKVCGYEIHHGLTQLDDPLDSVIDFSDGGKDAFVSDDDQIFGSYIHGLFDSPDALSMLLQWAGLNTAESVDINGIREQQLERLADMVEDHIDIDRVLQILALHSEAIAKLRTSPT